VERAAEALGAEIAADERQCGEPVGDVAPTMYWGMDGTGVPMRNSEVAGRAGKQPDGSAKTREAKLVTVWTAESRDDEGKPVRALETCPDGRDRITKHMLARSTYLGHSKVADTYWYLEAIPDLMRNIADSCQSFFTGGRL
jgi:hypothetical protein